MFSLGILNSLIKFRVVFALVIMIARSYFYLQPYVQMQGQPVENPSGNVPNVPNDGNFENQIRTPLENKLMAEVKMLREAIDCLEEQNRRLLIRNNFLQQTLDNYERETGLVNNFDFNPDIFGV